MSAVLRCAAQSPWREPDDGRRWPLAAGAALLLEVIIIGTLWWLADHAAPPPAPPPMQIVLEAAKPAPKTVAPPTPKPPKPEPKPKQNRRTREGLSKKEIHRCLKRYIVRELYPLILADLQDSRRLT